MISSYYSLMKIVKNKNVNRCNALFKYFSWQLIKIFNLFPREVNLSKSKIIIPDKIIANEGGTKLYTQGMYDYNVMNLIKFCTGINKSNFFDIGANFGTYSVIASENEGTMSYAFEPHPYTFTLLKNNLNVNNRTNVFPYNLAVGDENSIVRFTNTPGSSTNQVINNSNSDKSDFIEIESIRIIDFCKKNNLIPDIVKIDVEGFEAPVLKGFGEYLSKANVFVIEISEEKDFIVGTLNKAGFLGPLSFDFKSKTFTGFTEESYEDSVFVSETYMDLLKTKHNFTLKK